MAKVKFFFSNKQKKIEVPNGLRTTIRKCLETALDMEEFDEECEVSLSFVDNEEIKSINAEFRDKDAVTDVLSFPLGDDGYFDVNPDTNCLQLGDIVISLERAQEQATQYGHSFEREVAFLATHSIFHLLGYDHENGPEEEKEMFEKQEKVLEKLGIAR